MIDALYVRPVDAGPAGLVVDVVGSVRLDAVTVFTTDETECDGLWAGRELDGVTVLSTDEEEAVSVWRH